MKNSIVKTNESLALSLPEMAMQDKSILRKPIYHLARSKSIKAKDVYKPLLEELTDADLWNALNFAEVGLRYATVVDQNRLREEIGLEFIVSIDLIIDLVQEGLESSEKHIKKKAILLHSKLIDEHSEKKRFVDSVIVDEKIAIIAESLNKQMELEEEIIDI